MIVPLRSYAFGLPGLCVLPMLLASSPFSRLAPRDGLHPRPIADGSLGRAARPPAEIPSANWKVVKDRKGLCQISVPESWASALPGMVIAPGGGTHASLSSSPGGSLAEIKKIAAMAFKPTKVTEDSPTRYAFQYGTSGLHRYAARSFPGLVCAAEVDVSATEKAAALADDVTRIVASLDRAESATKVPRRSRRPGS